MDKLTTYLNSLGRGGRSEFARRARLQPAYLYRIEHGLRGVGLTVATRLVAASNGALRLEDFAEQLSRDEQVAA